MSPHLPGHLENLHVNPQLGWSFLHLQTADADVRVLLTWRFCWACESRPGTRCLDPAASRAARQPVSSADRETWWWASCRLITVHVHVSKWATTQLTSLSSRWIPLISKSNMNNSATRLERQTLISKKKSYIQLQTKWDEPTWYQRPAEPQCPGCPAVFSGFGRAQHSCSAWNKEPTINITTSAGLWWRLWEANQVFWLCCPGITYFSTTVPISTQVFSAAFRNSGSGCATFIKSAYNRKENDS